MSKRTLDSFFAPAAKRPRLSNGDAPPAPARLVLATLAPSCAPPSTHPTYPFPVSRLPPELEAALAGCPAKPGSPLVKPALGLDLLHFQPFVPARSAHALFEFLRGRLFFYRVRYPMKRDGVETLVNTPRFTTVFGVDATARFAPDGTLVDAASGAPIKPGTRYATRPRPLPQPLAHLAALVSRATGAEYNFCLVNYYATGQDSIAWHADDEAFLGRAPTIASLSLSEGARREFRMKPKPPPGAPPAAAKAARDPHELRFALAPGEMVVMRGETQARWLHALPKRADAGGRINITFRRAVVRGGTENYYRYNVGSGAVWRWDEGRREMVEVEEATNGENTPTKASTGSAS